MGAELTSLTGSSEQVVFLNKNEPDLMFDGLLKREKTRVSYFCVSKTFISPSLCTEKNLN